MLDAGKKLPDAQQRENLPFMMSDKPGIRRFIPVGTTILHAVFFAIAFDLAVAEHRQAGEGGKQGGDAEIFIAFAELLNGGCFIRVVHEIDIALHNLWIVSQGVFKDFTVFGVLLALEHIHESAVVDSVHAEVAHEVALHHPESLGNQQGVGGFAIDAINYLTPEFDRESLVEVGIGHPEGRA